MKGLNDNILFLTLTAPKKLEHSIFEIPTITQTLNINNLRTTTAKSINLYTIRKLVEYILKNAGQTQCLLLLFSRYCCLKVGRYCDPPSGAQGAKVLSFYLGKVINLLLPFQYISN